MACSVLAALASLPPTPTLDELAAQLAWPLDHLILALNAMKHSGMVEHWPDPDRPGAIRVMLSTIALSRLGLRLAPRGDRWNPDRPPSPATERPGGSPRGVDHGACRAIIAGSFGNGTRGSNE